MPKKRDGVMVDERDLMILYELEKDARIPWSQLARKLGVSEATIYLRVRKLRERGILKGFSAVVNKEKLGLSHRAIILLKVLVRGLPEIRRKMPKMKYVSRVLTVSGGHNILVEIDAPSQEALVEALHAIERMKGVEDIVVLTVIEELWTARSIVEDVLQYEKRGQARASGHSHHKQ